NHRAGPLAPAVSLAGPKLSLRRDQKTPEAALTLAHRGHVGISLKSQVDNPAIARAHGVERDHGPRLFGLAGQTVRQLPQPLLPTLPVALDVERDPKPVLSIVAEDDAAHEVLHGVQGLSAATDDHAAVGSVQGELNRPVGTSPLRSASHLLDGLRSVD